MWEPTVSPTLRFAASDLPKIIENFGTKFCCPHCRGSWGWEYIMSDEYFDAVIDREQHSQFGVVIEAGNNAGWKATPISDAGKPRKMPNRDVSAVSAKNFLPDIRMPSNMPPEPVGIADMAKMFDVTHRTLHFYEEKGIIASRRSGIMRVYSHADIRRMAVVNFCRDIGIPIATVQLIMQDLSTASTQVEADDLFQAALSARKKEVNDELSKLRVQMQKINNALAPDDQNAVGAAQTKTTSDVKLTTRERECLELMAEGYAPARLARTLGVPVEEHERLEAMILEKVGASDRYQAVAKSLQLGLISQNEE